VRDRATSACGPSRHAHSVLFRQPLKVDRVLRKAQSFKSERVPKRDSESSAINAGRSQQLHELSDEPSPCVDIELHQAFVSHFQQEGLASFFIHDIGAFHDLAHFERLLAERAQDIFSIIQHARRAKSL
jgi:hypothetical protein